MNRWSLVFAPLMLAAIPVPAFAANHDLTDAASRLGDPAFQDKMADMVSTMVDALMQINIGPLAEAVAQVDPESDAAYIPRDATLGEVAGGDDPYLAEHMGDDVRASAQMAGKMAASMAVMAPVLKDMARDMAAQWQQARRDARRR